MYSLKIVNGRKVITVHKAVLRKVKEVRDLLSLAGSDLHPDADRVRETLTDILIDQRAEVIVAQQAELTSA